MTCNFKKNIFTFFLLMFLISSPFILTEAHGKDEQSIVILPWKINGDEKLSYLSTAMVDMLSSRIGSSGGLVIAARDSVLEVLEKFKGIAVTLEQAQEISDKLSADFVLYGSLTIIGDDISIDGELFNKTTGASSKIYLTGRGLDSIISLVGELSIKVRSHSLGDKSGELEKDEASLGEVYKDQGIKELKKDPGFELIIKSKDLGGRFESMELVDLDGDGEDEYVLISKKKVVIQKKIDGSLKSLEVFGLSSDKENVWVSSMDANKDGRQELYLSRIGRSSAETLIVEFSNDTYSVISEGTPWLIRSLRAEGEPPVLLAQKFRRGWGYSGKIFKVKRSGAELIKLENFKTPRNINLYGFELIDLTGDKKNELVSIGKRGILTVFKKNEKEKWEKISKTSKAYGGTLNVIESSVGDLDLFDLSDTSEGFVLVEGNFFYEEMNREKGLEVIIAKNNPGGVFGALSSRVRVFDGASIRVLTWDGLGLKELQVGIEDIGGYVADINLKDDVLSILVIEGADFISRNEKSYVLFYRLTL